jgi:hypothetical protein
MATQLNMITTIRLPDGQQVGFADWGDKQLYGSGDFAHGFTQQQTTFFGYLKGQAVASAPPAGLASVPRTATDRDTNLEAPGAMASTEERLVYALKPEFYMLTADEPVNNKFNFESALPRTATGEPIPNPVALGWFFWLTLLQLKISQKEYIRAGTGYFNPGFGVFGNGGTMGLAAAAGRTYANAGLPSQEAVRAFVVPQYMGGQEKFELNLLNPTATPVNFGLSENAAVADNENAVMQIRVNVDGLYKRPVA